MLVIERLTAYLASTRTASDARAILLAFSLVPFFSALKLWLVFWHQIDQGAVRALRLHDVILLLGSDILLCFALAGTYFLIAPLLKSVGRDVLATAGVFTVHFAVVLFTVISFKVNQIYGSPMTVVHLRMADDLSVMRGSIYSYITLEGLGMLALGVLSFWAASGLHRRLAGRWTATRWRLWSVLSIACIAFAAASYFQLKGIYTYGLKKNAVINFMIYYQPLPEPGDFRVIAQRSNIAGQPDVDWHIPLQAQAAQADNSRDYSGVATGKNLLLVVLESTAKAYIDAETTPRLHNMIENSLVFPDYFTTAVNSFQSNYSIFYSDYVGDMSTVGHPNRIYNGSIPVTSLGEVFRGHGYRTSLFTSGLLSYTDIGYLWRDKGFDVVDGAESILRKAGGGGWVWGAHESQTVEAIGKWVDQEPGRPFFIAYVTGYPHHPYHTPTGDAPFPDDSWRNRYRNSLNYVDRNVGKLLDHLSQGGLLSQTVVAIVADHGETLDAAIAGHGIRMDLAEMQVPFYIHYPASFPHRVDRPLPANHLDLAPSLAGMLGIEAAPEWSGRNLLSLNVSPRKLFVQQNGSNGQSAIVDGDLVYLRDSIAGKDTLLRRKAAELKQLPDTPANRDLISRYSVQIRRFDDWVLLRHLDRACKLSPDPASACAVSQRTTH